MDAKFKQDWLVALRSGEYKQCRGALKTEDGYCCLGVAALIAGYDIDTHHDRVVRPGMTAEDEVGYDALGYVGLTERNKLIGMNDRGGSFAQIADFIEENL